MTYREWVQQHGNIDRLVRGDLPSDKDVGSMTDDKIIEKFGHRIRKVTDELGIDLDKSDLYEIIDRIYGVPGPPFHRSHYDHHC